jgi:hypothetical protein
MGESLRYIEKELDMGFAGRIARQRKRFSAG